MSKTKSMQTDTEEEEFMGIWHIIKMSDWDEDYLNTEVQAYINVDYMYTPRAC